MITALQDVQNLSVVNAPPARDRAALTGDVRPLSATPSAVVLLGAALQPSLTYDSAGRLESQVAQTTTALTTTNFAATQPTSAFTTSGATQSALSASATSFAQADLTAAPTIPNLIATLASPQTVTEPPELAVTPLPFVPGVPLTTRTVTFEPPVTANFVVAPDSTFNPAPPDTPDITTLVTSGQGSPATPSDVIANTDQSLAGAPNTATFALPPPNVAALPAADEAQAAIPLAASASTFASAEPGAASAPATEAAAIAAPLTPPALADTRIVTPGPVAATTPATAQTEAVLSALNSSRANTVTTAPNVVGAPTAITPDTIAPAAPTAPDTFDAVAAPAAATTAAATADVPSVSGTAAPGTLNAPVVPPQAPTAALEAGILTPDDIVTNPFYPAMAASLYLSAMSFRLQQSSAAELNSPADNVQMVGDVRAVSGVQSDRQGPADDFRNLTRTFA